MATLATLMVKLIADTQHFSTEMEKAQLSAVQTAEKIGKSWKHAGAQIIDAGQTMTAGVTLPILGAGVAAIKMASSLEETKNKASVVFGSMSSDVLAWSQTSATAMGMSQNTALSAAATYGNLFVSMGMGEQASANMSTSLVGLASDLASFNDMNPTEVLDKLRAGLTGESEPLKALGVNLNAAMVAAKAADMGLVEMTTDTLKLKEAGLSVTKTQNDFNKAVAWYGPNSMQAAEAGLKLEKAQRALENASAGSAVALDAAAKAQATYALILEQTTTAQGDFARTSESLANQQRSMRAQLEDSAAMLGNNLLPYVVQAVQWFNNLLTQFRAMSPEMQQMVLIGLGIAAAIGPVLIIVGQLVTAIGAIIPIVTAVAGVLSGPVLLVIAGVAAAVALLYMAWTNNWGGIQQKTQAVIAFLQNLIQGGLAGIQAFWQAHGAQILTVINLYWNMIMSIVNTAMSVIQNIIRAVQAAINGDWYQFGASLRAAWDALWNGLGTIITASWAFLKSSLTILWNNITTWFKSVDWAQVGTNIVQGIANGIIAGISFIKNAATNAANAALEAAKGFLGIHSPSTRMEDEVGWQMAAGVAQGWSGGLETMMPATMPALTDAASGAARNVSAPQGGRGGMTININLQASGVVDEYETARRLGAAVGVILRERGLA